jgi:hypothetical protein
MICPRCQNQLPDGSVACNRCGFMFNYQPQPQQQMYQQPYQQSQYQNTSPAQPKKSIKKADYRACLWNRWINTISNIDSVDYILFT